VSQRARLPSPPGPERKARDEVKDLEAPGGAVAAAMWTQCHLRCRYALCPLPDLLRSDGLDCMRRMDEECLLLRGY
jgi:hypothetical protein